MKPATLLFDLDGTLTDSRPGIVACIEYALDKMGVSHSGDLGFCLGPPLHQSFASLLKTDRREDIDRAVALYRERFSTIGMFENSVYPGISELLPELRSNGHQLFIATSKPHVYARQIAAHFHLDQFFEKIYGSEIDGRLANKGELIAHLLQSEQLSAPMTIMIGDREHDILGAKQSKLISIGVLWGYGSADEFEKAGADHLARTPRCIAKAAKGHAPCAMT